MSNTMKRSIAILLVWLQIVLLLTAALPRVLAAEGEADPAAATAEPRLNEVITGSVQFGSFNYSSDVEYEYEYTTGGIFGMGATTHYGTWKPDAEGADYLMPFVYTDDYFAASAIQPNVTGKEMNWDALENKSLATASMDFTMACYGSNEETGTGEHDHDRYSKNGEQFLADCGFGNIEVNAYTYDGSEPNTKENAYNKFPSQDSIGVVIGSKPITVYEGDHNASYTLVAIGVRGAGYGAEWASNLTLGTSGEHRGFREAANKVEYKLDEYLSQHGITASDNVKFWVCGYSRAGAVANLVAGDLSSNAKYNVGKEHVYGYTFESAAGANSSIDPDGTVYPNIHNILNKMDAVPRVSSEAFGNNRYGVDYLVPYYGNTQNQGTRNSDYYNRMYSILETVAQGYPNAARPSTPPRPSGSYNSNSLKWNSDLKVEDPVLTSAKPNTVSGGTYPVNGEIQVYYFALAAVVNGNIGWGNDPMGRVAYEGKWDSKLDSVDIGTKRGSYYYIQLDTFLDGLVREMFASRAWDYNAAQHVADPLTDALTHRRKYVDNGYQDAVRFLVANALGTPGGKLTDMFNGITDDLMGKAGDLLGFLNNVRSYDSSKSETTAESASNNLKSVLDSAVSENEMFNKDQTTLNQAKAAVAAFTPVVTRLYLYDRNHFASQYFGTLLKYGFDTILVTHTPELDVSWQMAMDENYTSDYRKITLPLATNVRMYEFSGANDFGTPDFDGTAPLVAQFKNGEVVSNLDQRIQMTPNGNTITIRYPGNLDIRFDVRALEAFNSSAVVLTDMKPTKGTNVESTYTRDATNGNINSAKGLTSLAYNLQEYTTASAQENNTFLSSTAFTVSPGETLQILAKAGSNSLDAGKAAPSTYDVRKTFVKVVDFGERQTVATNVYSKGTPTGTGGTFDVDSAAHALTFTPAQTAGSVSAFSGLTSSTYSFVTDAAHDTTRGSVAVIPASSVYYNDSVGDNRDLRSHADSQTTILESSRQNDGTVSSSTLELRFFGTGIDAYCTCDTTAGWVRADVYAGTDTSAAPLQSKIMGNYYDGTLYNVPTLSFRELGAADYYTLRLTASFGKDYKFDGVRVFNTAPTGALKAALAKEDEGSAAYVNVRDLLLPAKTFEDVTDTTVKEGVAFFTGDAGHQTFADYTAIGPKNEAYLTAAGQGIAFSVANPDRVHVAIGLRRADGTGDNLTGRVRLNGVLTNVTGVDTYYPVTPQNGNVSVTYDDQCSGTIGITCIKLTDRTDVAPAAAQTEPEGPLNAPRIRASAKLMAFVNAPAPEPTPEPTPTPEPSPEPTPDKPVAMDFTAMWQMLWSSLMRALGSLFSGLGSW